MCVQINPAAPAEETAQQDIYCQMTKPSYTQIEAIHV